MKVVLDATDARVGRLGSFAAKELLKGNEVDIYNCDKAILTGKKEVIINKIVKLRAMGGTSLKGPKYPKIAERLVKRMIRGMLPWKNQKGRDAFKRLKCYSEDSAEEDKKNIKAMGQKRPYNYLTIKRVIELL